MKTARLFTAAAITLSATLVALACSESGSNDDPPAETPDATANPEAGAEASETGVGCSSDLRVDPKNCGGCGHDCLGGACLAATCQPAILASDQSRPTAVAVDDTHVYWLAAAAIWRIPLAQGGVATSIANKVTSRTFGLDATHVYYLEGAVVARVAKAGGPAEPLAAVDPDAPSSSFGGEPITVDANHVYWTTGQASTDALILGFTWMLPKNGDAGRPLVYNADGIGLTTDDTNVYWTRANGRVYYVPKDAGSDYENTGGVEIARAQGGPQSIVVTPKELLWANHETGSIKRVALGALPEAGAPGEFASGSRAEGIAVDGVAVYWTSSTGDQILSCPISGCTGEPRIIARDQALPRGIAVTSRAIFWANGGSGTIMMVAK